MDNRVKEKWLTALKSGEFKHTCGTMKREPDHKRVASPVGEV